MPHRHGERFEGGSAESGTDMGADRMSRGKELRRERKMEREGVEEKWRWIYTRRRWGTAKAAGR